MKYKLKKHRLTSLDGIRFKAIPHYTNMVYTIQDNGSNSIKVTWTEVVGDRISEESTTYIKSLAVKFLNEKKWIKV